MEQLENQVNEVAIGFFLKGIEPLEQKPSGAKETASVNSKKEPSKEISKEIAKENNKNNKNNTSNSNNKKKEYLDKFEYEDSQIVKNTVVKQKTSIYKNLEAKEIDDSTKQRFGLIFSQQLHSPMVTPSLDMDISDEED
ncbi:hypothetical protein ABK040_016099 [Willaertia magna]